MAPERLRSHSIDNEFSSQSNMHGHGTPEPLGLEYIASSLKMQGFEFKFSSHNELQIINKSGKCLSLFSSNTSEYPQVAIAAKSARERGDVVILGGYHACGCRDYMIDKLFNYIVIGEGEEVGVAIARAHVCDDWEDFNSFESSTIGDTCIVHAPRIANLDSLPPPVRSEERLAQYCIHDLIWPPTSQHLNTALVLGSRGCLNDCEFCASSSVWGRGVRLRSVERVVDELCDLKRNFGTNTIVFIDQSFGQDRQWTLSLCNAIQEANLGISWYHQSNLTIERDVIRAMTEAGCTKIGFGLEGISPRAVALIKPVNPCDLDSINSLFDYCNSLGLFVKVYLMIGFPWETDEIITEYFDWIPRIRANQIKLSYFTPFPGSRVWGKHRHQLATNDWAEFDTVKQPVVLNPNVSVTRYHDIRNELFKSFYGSPTYADVTRKMISLYPHYVESYREFTNYLYHFKMILGNETWLKWVCYKKASRAAKARCQ